MLHMREEQIIAFSNERKKQYIQKMLRATEDICVITYPSEYKKQLSEMTLSPGANIETPDYLDKEDFYRENNKHRAEVIKYAISMASTFGIQKERYVSLFVQYSLRCAPSFDPQAWPEDILQVLQNQDVSEAKKTDLLDAELIFGGEM